MFPATRSEALRLLSESVPGDVGPLAYLGEGDFCYAFRADRRVFRIARHPDAAVALRTESCLLPRIAGQLALPVPHPILHQGKKGLVYAVHPVITGEAMTRVGWHALPRSRRARAAADLAAFLRSLHDLPATAAGRCGIPRVDSASLSSRLRTEAHGLLFPLLPADGARRLDSLLERWAGELDGSAGPPVLLHRDIAPGHVLHDSGSGALTGIIDFSDLAVGDPARDFIYIHEDFGPELLAAVLAAYGRERGHALLPRIRLWYLLETIAWTLLAVRSGNEADLKEGVDVILRELGTPGLPFV